MSEILCSSKEQRKQRCDWFIPIDLYDWIYSCIPRIKILPRILHIIVLTLPVAAYSCTGCKNPVVRITYHYSFSRPCCSCAYHTADITPSKLHTIHLQVYNGRLSNLPIRGLRSPFVWQLLSQPEPAQPGRFWRARPGGFSESPLARPVVAGSKTVMVWTSLTSEWNVTRLLPSDWCWYCCRALSAAWHCNRWLF